MSQIVAHTLNELRPGQTGIVTELYSQGIERRRMMDLGIVPGTVVQVEMNSPLGDPVAYRVRGAIVALRQGQARLIGVTLPEAAHQSEESEVHSQ